MVTKHGVIKKCELTEFDNPMARGIIAVALDEGDELWRRRLTNGENYIFLGSHEGMAIRFSEERGARRWAGRRAACAPWNWRRATTWSASRWSKRTASFCPSPRTATASARRSRTTG